MLTLHRLIQRLKKKGFSPSYRSRLSGYLIYAAGEIILIVSGILVAINLNNWNQARQQEEQFYNTIERIYQAVRLAQDGVRWNMVMVRNQITLIDQILEDPDLVPDEELIYRIFNLDAPYEATSPALFRSYHYHASLLAVDSGDPAQVEIASRISEYLQRATWNEEIVVPKVDRSGLVAAVLGEQGLARPYLIWAGRDYYRFDREVPLYDADDLALVRTLLKSRKLRLALISLRARKLSDIDFMDNDRENTVAVLKLIREHRPGVALHFKDIGIIGSALPDGWERSLPMQKQPGPGSVWVLETALTEGSVKFRENDSWTHNWGGAGFPDGETYYFGDDIPVQPGRYRVMLNLDENSYRFEAQDSPGTQSLAR